MVDSKMECPFKEIKKKHLLSEEIVFDGFHKLITHEIIHCKLMCNEDDECIGEERCILLKR
jgi:hypothetical protein